MTIDVQPFCWLPEDEGDDRDETADNLPLPLLVARQWDFPLQYYLIDGQHQYAIRDWIVGLTEGGQRQAAKMWNRMKLQLSTSIRQLAYVAADGKKYASDFTDENGLYLIAQHLRVTAEREHLGEIQRYLAAAGVFADTLRRDPQARAQAAAAFIDADPEAAVSEVMDRVAQGYQRAGRSDSWIEVRVQGIVTRKQFTCALRAAVIQAPPSVYAQGTEKLYKGLLDRTTAQLRGDLTLTRRQNPRDHMGEYALAYIEMTERLCRDLLGEADTVLLSQALDIIWKVAQLISAQYKATQEFLGRDLLTGRALLPPKKE